MFSRWLRKITRSINNSEVLKLLTRSAWLTHLASYPYWETIFDLRSLLLQYQHSNQEGSIFKSKQLPFPKYYSVCLSLSHKVMKNMIRCLSKFDGSGFHSLWILGDRPNQSSLPTSKRGVLCNKRFGFCSGFLLWNIYNSWNFLGDRNVCYTWVLLLRFTSDFMLIRWVIVDS